MNGSAKHCADRGTVYLFLTFTTFFTLFFDSSPSWEIPPTSHAKLVQTAKGKFRYMSLCGYTSRAERDIHNYKPFSSASLIMTSDKKILVSGSTDVSPRALSVIWRPRSSELASRSRRGHRTTGIIPEKCTINFSRFFFSSHPLAHNLTRSSKVHTSAKRSFIRPA